jgi:hypothetical protein
MFDMAINGIAITGRNVPFDKRINANGSYTLPQFGFVPHPGTRPLGMGHVGDPVAGHMSNPGFIAAAHVDANMLPPNTYGRPFGLKTQIAQIQANTSIFNK